MWAIDNQTRYAAERTFVRDVDGAEIWLVAVRATFEIGPDGKLVTAKEQREVCQAPLYVGEPTKSSLRYDQDLVRVKTGTDILLHAMAHAPRGKPAPYVDVAMRVGPIAKELRVYGERVWEGAFILTASRPEPFITLPICYERALGGPLSAEPDAPRDPYNKVGTGRVAIKGAPLPNCEYPRDPIRLPSHRGPPAGFGPIPGDWQQRVMLAGTYDDAWKRDRQPLVPKDFQDAYFRCAPVDQQSSDFLVGGEQVSLCNLTPEGRLEFQLPRIALGFRTRIDNGTTYHRSNLHTVIIEPEERRLIMVWQTALPCHHTLYTLKETVVFEKERMPLGPQAQPDAELAV